MAASFNARESPALGELFSDADLCGQEFANDVASGWKRTGFARTKAFAGLVKAIAQGDRTLEVQILRSWGIR